MSERVAIVVGAGGELGRATAAALTGTGYTVIGVDRNEQGLKELSDGIRRETGDATDPATAKSLIDRIAAEAGPPEVLVNTIGTFRLGEALAATPEDLRVLMDVNLGAALWLSQAVEPYMRQRGKGSIVHVSARPATDPTAGMAAYSLSKAALAGSALADPASASTLPNYAPIPPSALGPAVNAQRVVRRSTPDLT